jgi:long-chain acyl-CoA synthetase
MITSGGPRNSRPGTLNQLFFDAVATYRRPDALQVKREGRYQPISHDELADRVRRVAIGLEELGVRAGDRVAILSENRPEWAVSDYACLSIGAIDVPIYPNLPASQVAFILRDSGAVAILASTAEQVAKLPPLRGECPALRLVIGFGAAIAGADMSLADVESLGAAADDAARQARYREQALAVRADDVATLIYTSGTTGTPKGVVLTHDNLYSNVMAGAAQIPFEVSDTSLSFLPLSHIFERNGGHFLMMATGTSIAYAESIDAVPANLLEVRPTLVFSVPRLLEKMYARVLENALAGGAVKKRMFLWARGVADRWATRRLAGETPRGLLAWQYTVARKLVFSKLHARTGGRLRYFVSGGAPLSPEINRFFFAAGLPVLEGYGLTETSPVISVNTPQAFRIGTVGKPLPGVEVLIAPDGEILTRGPHVMKGYYNNPQATAEAIDANGWFHTGDIGEVHDGFLTITDRKKDMIVTAGGKNIAPQPIENKIKTNKYVSQAVMIGDRRKFPSVLVVPNWNALEKWAQRQDLGAWTSRAELLAMPEIRAKMDAEVLREVAPFAHYERPKKIALLEHDFSIERGELTPKMSVKRKVVDAQYKSVIDDLYAEHE